MKRRISSRTRKVTSSDQASASLKKTGADIGDWNRWRLGGLLAVVIISLVINCLGLSWGRSGLVPWQSDSLEGITAVRENQRMFGQWTYKYPRGQFLVNAIFYQPLLDYWENHPDKVRMPDGRTISRSLNLQRLDILARISRFIGVAMGVGTVLAVFFTARFLFRDYLAGLLAALALSLSHLFVFYCHLGNVDVPYIFWFAWGIYWGVKAVYVGKWRHFILLGLFNGYSVCTKEPAGGYVIGLGIAIWVAMIGRDLKADRDLKKAVLSVFSPKVLVAVLVFTLCFAVMNGFLAGPEEFFNRMGYWEKVPKITGGTYKMQSDQLPLLVESGRQLYGGLGWPLLVICIISVVYCAVKNRWKFAFGIAPLLVFYVLVIMNIRFVVPRFLLGGYPGLALLVGKTCADWLRWERIPSALRILPVGFVYVLSLLYCVGLDLEMRSDSRARTEQWFYKNVGPDSIIGVGIYNKIYAPRLHLNGYRRLICPWRISSILEASGRHAPQPEYLIIPPSYPCIDEDREQELREKLFKGQLNYEQVVSFKVKYLFPSRTIFGFAGWQASRLKFLSPEMVIFRKKQKRAEDSKKSRR